MISKISHAIASRLLRESVIDLNDIELYEYGLFVLITKIIFLIISVICGLLLGIAVESIIFYIAFSIVRSYAGGVHASSERACFISTTISLTVCNGLIKVFSRLNMPRISLLILCISAICVAILSPLDSANKPLSKDDKQHYRKIILKIVLAIVLISIMVMALDMLNILYALTISLLLESALLIAGKIKK